MDAQVDRLSSLSNDLIHLIFSFIDVKYAIQAIALSSRYRFIWTSLPYLNFTDDGFLTLDSKFSEFVTGVLSHRDTQIEVYSVKLIVCEKVSDVSVKGILNYAFSHNVQQMNVRYWCYMSDDDFPLSLFRSQSLKQLTLSGSRFRIRWYINPSSTWELPALTTLRLKYIEFDDKFTDLLSKCSNLKNLTLNYCNLNISSMRQSIHGDILHSIDICHPRLSNLTLNNGDCYYYVLNVDAPQLKNLTIKDWSVVHLHSAPKLVSLVFRGYNILQYSPNGLSSLEKTDLCFYQTKYDRELDESYAHKVVDLLQQVRSIKYLTLNTETIQLLSSFKELISRQPSPFTNLKNLNVYPQDAYSLTDETMPIEVKNYLLDSSFDGTFTLVSCKEIRALKNAVFAQNLMAKLWVTVEEEKANCETNTSPVKSHDTKVHDKREARVKNQNAQPVKKMQLDIKERMSEINICWKDLCLQINQGSGRTSSIVDKLRFIEESLLKDLPTSKRDKLQACFSSLQAEVYTVVKKIIESRIEICQNLFLELMS